MIVRAADRTRLNALAEIYANVGLPLELLHSGMGERGQLAVVAGLKGGSIRAVGVVGMLGEGFDLPSLRIVAYHDKHRSLPATIQLIGRAARSDPSFPQESVLVTVHDEDVFPELQGIVRRLYEEDSDWSSVLPGIIDTQIADEAAEREYSEEFGEAHFEIVPERLQPMLRAVVYEVPDVNWKPSYTLGDVPKALALGQLFAEGRVIYSAVSGDGRMLVTGVRHVGVPKWSDDPGLLSTTYSLHIATFRPAPRTDLPGLLFINSQSRSGQVGLFEVLELEDVAAVTRPERIGQYIDGLDRTSVSAVGLRSTNAANRGSTSYRNHMGASVDRGLRAVDTTRHALGHVNLQVAVDDGSTNAGAALEKGKIWATRYVPLRAYDEWIEAAASLLWFERVSQAGALIPALSRGRRLENWPAAPALAAELHPALLGRGYTVSTAAGSDVAIEDVELFVAASPIGTLDGKPSSEGLALVAAAPAQGDDDDEYQLVWSGRQTLRGEFRGDSLGLRRGRSRLESFASLLEEYPPTIYFLDGTTTVGQTAYVPDRVGTGISPSRIVVGDWAGTDVTAETEKTATARGHGERSVHAALVEWLGSRDRRGTSRWILLNDGPGEIADIVVVEPLATGEVHVGLWHAKASVSDTPGLRVNEIQVVVAQAIRSRRWLPSVALWAELAKRYSGERKPEALLQNGSDDPALLRQYLGLDPVPPEFVTWTSRAPVVRGEIGVVQPGLSRAAALAEPFDGSEAGVRTLLTVLEDTGTADGHEVVVLSSE